MIFDNWIICWHTKGRYEYFWSSSLLALSNWIDFRTWILRVFLFRVLNYIHTGGGELEHQLLADSRSNTNGFWQLCPALNKIPPVIFCVCYDEMKKAKCKIYSIRKLNIMFFPRSSSNQMLITAFKKYFSYF